ncbi:hypothetical protein CLIB1423_04S05534 [[Candida] railenensis]|uniref:Uncharacterized protein n=1 Tax=[Candida] railenensis TaxID=45579 RepID=A0A9P0VXC4_9ASCO|nr:hypothetical protein CLIB1423_04S05534 [[Candida] railenensis]
MSKPIPLPSILKLNSLLKKSVFSRNFYQEINDKVLSQSATVDRNLYFICYFTLLLSSILDNKPKIRAFVSSQRNNLIKLISGSTPAQSEVKKATEGDIVRSNEAATSTANSKDKSNLAVHLKAISSYLSDIRIFNRLTDSIKYMPWIIDEYRALKDPAHAAPKLDRLINLVQALNCLVLELLENAGWLTDHNWVGTNNNEYWCIETYIWCSRVWGAYLVIEIIELFRRVPVSKWDKSWKINVFKQLVQVPLVVHWSLYDGCLSPFWVGVCGSCASWWDFKDLWSSVKI